MEPLGKEAFDCIFIRNVLIYFDRRSKQAVVKNLLGALAPSGYLAVGPSEGIYDLLAPLQKVSPLIYRQADAPAPSRSAGPKGGAPR
jgi:chemotaxis protein methyltransferase CheR